MRLSRVVVRLPANDRDGLDRLRKRYFDETSRGISRAAIVRALVEQALRTADGQAATDVLRALESEAPSLRLRPSRRAIRAARALARQARQTAVAGHAP